MTLIKVRGVVACNGLIEVNRDTGHGRCKLRRHNISRISLFTPSAAAPTLHDK
ncbi:MAG: hypothetical protein P8I96_04600 [Opitutae bacterium]|nr:hypothetical protein [Opitutae bacterium]